MGQEKSRLQTAPFSPVSPFPLEGLEELGRITWLQKNENIKEDDRYRNESFQAEKMRRRKGLSRDQTKNTSVGVTSPGDRP